KRGVLGLRKAAPELESFFVQERISEHACDDPRLVLGRMLRDAHIETFVHPATDVGEFELDAEQSRRSGHGATRALVVLKRKDSAVAARSHGFLLVFERSTFALAHLERGPPHAKLAEFDAT